MLPEEFLKRMQEMLGDNYPAFLDSYSRECCHSLRINPLKEKSNLLLRNPTFTLRPVPWEADGFYYASTEAFGKHPYHAAGVYYIQEASAMAAVPCLAPRPGERILDLCAAPGGKSTQLAAAMRGEGLLVSNEIHPARAKILSENIERMGVANCLVLNESPEALAGIFEGFFDKILVDAPCSGEGMFRKNPDACAEWSPENVRLCADRQLAILSCAASMLRPGGRMVYSTCTFAPEENEGTVSRFLKAHPDFSAVPANPHPSMSAGNPAWINDPAPGIEHTVRLFPHCLCGEGHFLALLQKEGEPGSRRLFPGGDKADVPEKDCKEYLEFCDSALLSRPAGRLLRFGEQLYLAPEELPSIRGLRVLRPGLHLGTLKKNRFEPAHALALALPPGSAAHVWELPSTDSTIRAYLNGQTFPADGPKGWYLITVDGYSIGWGKLAGNVMKNHYPKGLRTLS
ncbi:MAG: RsmF rRNA methyltransferase first C-terminal domain-containing protein [Blautia sp.]|nr:RsmF rRNA methyltransferase first C-terminal domain-containing protein [Blautia sp.]